MQPCLTPSDEWIKETTRQVIQRIRLRAQQFQSAPAPESPDEKYQDRVKRYKFITELLDDADKNKDSRRMSPLERIAKGFLVEFIRQSEQDHPPVNVEHNRNPEALAYWLEHQREFVRAAEGGVFQTAAGYQKLQRLRGNKINRKISWEAIAEVIRSSVDVFKEEYPKLNTGHEPNASVYNEHYKILGVALGGYSIAQQLQLKR